MGGGDKTSALLPVPLIKKAETYPKAPTNILFCPFGHSWITWPLLAAGRLAGYLAFQDLHQRLQGRRRLVTAVTNATGHSIPLAWKIV